MATVTFWTSGIVSAQWDKHAPERAPYTVTCGNDPVRYYETRDAATKAAKRKAQRMGLQRFTRLLLDTPTRFLSDALMEQTYCDAMAAAGRDEELIVHWLTLPDVRGEEIDFMNAYECACLRMHGEAL